MNVKVAQGKALFIIGPASLSISRGEASVLGAFLPAGFLVKVRMGRALPVYCTADSELDVRLGETASATEFDGDTVPQGWKQAVRTILELTEEGSIVVMVVGGAEAGKTTFTVFLANRALSSGLKVNIVDADVGQSDVGPPATVGTHRPHGFVYDLFYKPPDRLVFIGSTTPANVQERMLNAISTLCQESREKSRLIVVNMDGWVEGDDAQGYRLRMADRVKPDVVVLFLSSETVSLRDRLRDAGWQVVEVNPSYLVRRRSREERRKLRWQAYCRYMHDAKLRAMRLGDVKVSGLEAWQPGVLAGLYDAQGELLGLGVVDEVNLSQRLMKLFTPVRQPVDTVEIGQTVVDLLKKNEK